MAFDGIVIRAICNELQNLVGGRIDKIYQPDKNNIVVGLYSNFNNYALNINLNPQNYRIHLTTHSKPNPKFAPNFCMVLRKHIIGLHIKNIITSNLERVITIELEGFNDVDDIISKKLIIELMGKHCNLILLDDQNIIIDSIKHITSENSLRTIFPHHKYTYLTSEKLNFEDYFEFVDFNKVINSIDDLNIDNLSKNISNTFNGLSKSFIDFIIRKLNINKLNSDSLKQIHSYIKDTIFNVDKKNVMLEEININNKNDYYIFPINDNNNQSNSNYDENFPINFFIDDFYYKKESYEEFTTYRNALLKLILDILKKYKKRLLNISEKLSNCENMDKYKLYGELLTSNLYKFSNENKPKNKITIENYYDNNNLITIPLDTKYNLNKNASLYYKKYNKLKNTLEIVTTQKEETLNDLDYIESVIYEIENTNSLDELSQIFDEISKNVLFKEKLEELNLKKHKIIKKSKLTNNKNVSFNPIKYNIDGFTLFVGRNNIENDYLTLKFAKKTDIWFHTKDFHGSHAILKIEKENPKQNILIKCAEIAAYHSKARNSSNVPVDYCEVKYVKKPSHSKPGMVIYTNNKTLYVDPKE